LREVELEIGKYFFAYFDPSLEESEKMRTVLVSAPLHVARAVGKILGESLEILLRVEHGLFQVIQQTL
jgi:hypothetical protein